MAPLPTRVCVRCGRQNASRARYCAQCGLHLEVIQNETPADVFHGRPRKRGMGVVLFVVLLGLLLATIGSIYRVEPRPSKKRIPQIHQFDYRQRQWEAPAPPTGRGKWHYQVEEHREDR